MAQLRSILDYKHVITGIWGCRPTPLLKEEGWTRPQGRCREATFAGADGVVTHDETFQNADHPVCGAKVGFAAFLSRSHPSCIRRGVARLSFVSILVYRNAARAALNVALGRIALAESSGSGA